MAYRVTLTPLTDYALIDIRYCSDSKACEVLSGFFDREAIISLTAEHCLVRSTRRDEQRCFDSIVSAMPQAVVTINTDHYRGVSVSGDDYRAILSQACSLDLDTLNTDNTGNTVFSTRCRFARTAAIIQVRDVDSAVDVFVEASYADYLMEWLRMAANN